MKSEEQLLKAMESNVLILEDLDGRLPKGDDIPAEDLERLIGAAVSVVILAWVLDLEDEADKHAAIARAKASLKGAEVERG